MDPELAQKVRGLLEAQRIASLGTLHAGEPYVSMVPFAIPTGTTDFIIHVSKLAAHTKDMVASKAVSLLVVAPLNPSAPPQAVARMTIQADAIPLEPETPEHAIAKKTYLARFPESEMTFELGDFSLFAIRPRSVRWVGGFAQAKTLTPAGLGEALGIPR
jgi:putative heme iron utilization protein